MAKVFISYSHKDEDLRQEIDAALSPLRRQGLIDIWHDRRIVPGEDFANEIDQNLEEADIILLLVSNYFINSDYAYGIEVERALAREAEGSAQVIPVILRPTDWHDLPFGRLQALPPEGKPVTSFPDIHEALKEVSKGIRKVIKCHEPGGIGSAPGLGDRVQPREERPQSASNASAVGPRSANLRMRREFTDREREEFLKSSYRYVETFFKNSLEELEERVPGVASEFEQVTSTRFTAAIYQEGSVVAECTIWRGNRASFAEGIGYSSQRTTEENSYNELMVIESDGYTQYFRSTMGGLRGRDRDEQLTPEGVSEYLWGLLIEHLQ